jgi:PAS domain-containing protein
MAFTTNTEDATLDQQRLKSLVNSMADGVIATDQKGTIVLYNGAAMNILDRNTEIKGRKIGNVIKTINGKHEEVDFQKMLGGNRGQNFGVIETLRANYEVIQGLHLYVMQEYGKLDLDKSLSAKEAYTLGVQWFFRPHVEVAGGLRKQRSLSMSDSFGDFAWAMMHYYL